VAGLVHISVGTMKMFGVLGVAAIWRSSAARRSWSAC
jgi:hypothetical protein